MAMGGADYIAEPFSPRELVDVHIARLGPADPIRAVRGVGYAADDW